MTRQDQNEDQMLREHTPLNSGILPLIESNSQHLQISENGREHDTNDILSQRDSSLKKNKLRTTHQLNITVESFESEMKKTKGSNMFRKSVKKYSPKPATPEKNPETYSQHCRRNQSKRKNHAGKPQDRYSKEWLDIENY